MICIGFEGKMVIFREVREVFLFVNVLDLIVDEEMLLFYDVNILKNFDIFYWKYEKFNLDFFFDDECKSEFCFLKYDIYNLFDVLDFFDKIICLNCFYVYSDEVLCLFLCCFVFLCRYEDFVF